MPVVGVVPLAENSSARPGGPWVFAVGAEIPVEEYPEINSLWQKCRERALSNWHTSPDALRRHGSPASLQRL
jgi:hypothetical protein